MIKNFRCYETEGIYYGRHSRKLPQNIQQKALDKLCMLASTERLDDLRIPPGNKLEKLHGDRNGQHSIRINDQWRICFKWIENHAYLVEIVDYHS